MKVTEFAKRAGVGPDVVRYYVREGLLAPSRNPANGYKLFGSPHLSRLRFIRQAQALGFLSGSRVLIWLERLPLESMPSAQQDNQAAPSSARVGLMGAPTHWIRAHT